MRCKECIYYRGYYNRGYHSDSWCEKNNPNFEVSEEVSCKDFEWLLPEAQESQDYTSTKSETKTANAIIEITARLVDVDLLEEILFTLNYINHKQIINLASLNFKDQDRSETYELEEIDLDALIGKLKMVLE